MAEEHIMVVPHGMWIGESALKGHAAAVLGAASCIQQHCKIPEAMGSRNGQPAEVHPSFNPLSGLTHQQAVQAPVEADLEGAEGVYERVPLEQGQIPGSAGLEHVKGLQRKTAHSNSMSSGWRLPGKSVDSVWELSRFTARIYRCI